MAALPADPAQQLRTEKTLLLKAERNIGDGWKRLRSQQQLLADMRGAGQDSQQEERLVRLLQQTLIESERHRVLIEERVAYLERHS